MGQLLWINHTQWTASSFDLLAKNKETIKRAETFIPSQLHKRFDFWVNYWYYDHVAWFGEKSPRTDWLKRHFKIYDNIVSKMAPLLLLLLLLLHSFESQSQCIPFVLPFTTCAIACTIFGGVRRSVVPSLSGVACTAFPSLFLKCDIVDALPIRFGCRTRGKGNALVCILIFFYPELIQIG